MAIVAVVAIGSVTVAMIIKYLSITMIITKDGRELFLPDSRPNDYFLKGDQVAICNTSMSRHQKDPGKKFFPRKEQKIISGVVTCSSLHDDECIKVKAEGHEHIFTRSCPLIMHDWEYEVLRDSFFTRKLWSRSSMRITYWFNPRQFEQAIKRVYWTVLWLTTIPPYIGVFIIYDIMVPWKKSSSNVN